MAEKPGAVIVGGDFQGLGVLRSLAGKGIPTVLLDHDLCIGRFSRHCRRFFRCPKPRDESLFLDFMMTLAEREGLGGWVVYPNDDDTVRLLSKNKSALEEHYLIPFPEWEVTRIACDKGLTHEAAHRLGILVPRTFYPKDVTELQSVDIEFPCVVKPAVKEPFYSLTKKKAIRVDDRDELLATFRATRDLAGDSKIMIQELIPGGASALYSVGSMFKDSHFLGKVVARRLRQHPMDFGHATTYAVTVDMPELEETASSFLSGIGYYGMSEVEFMYDSRTDEYKLLEVNPRPWGWHTLAMAAGADIPYLLYSDMTGQEAQQNGFKVGTKWLRLTTDLPTAASEMVKGNLGLTEYLRSMTGDRHFAVLSLRDPLPFLAEIMMLPYLWRRRGF